MVISTKQYRLAAAFFLSGGLLLGSLVGYLVGENARWVTVISPICHAPHGTDHKPIVPPDEQPDVSKPL